MQHFNVAVIKRQLSYFSASKWQGYAIYIFAIGLFMYTSIFVVQHVTSSFDNELTSELIQDSPIKINSSGKRLLTVADLHLFGKPERFNSVSTINAPESNLQLKLKGVFASSDQALAFAVISDSSNIDKAYRVNDSISPGVTLHAVYNDRVILKRNGLLESLRMKDEYDVNKFAPLIDKRRKISNPGNQKLPVSTLEKLKEIKNVLMNNPGDLLKDVRITPVFQNNKVKGYHLNHNDAELMKNIGLKKTDIVTSVNREALNDPIAMYGLIKGLPHQNVYELTIERDNEIKTIKINM